MRKKRKDAGQKGRDDRKQPFFEGDIFITEAFEFSFQVFVGPMARAWVRRDADPGHESAMPPWTHV